MKQRNCIFAVRAYLVAGGLAPGTALGGAQPVQGSITVQGATAFQTVNGSARLPILVTSGQSVAPIVLNVSKP